VDFYGFQNDCQEKASINRNEWHPAKSQTYDNEQDGKRHENCYEVRQPATQWLAIEQRVPRLRSGEQSLGSTRTSRNRNSTSRRRAL
jgi:hypothetical protein